MYIEKKTRLQRTAEYLENIELNRFSFQTNLMHLT